MSEEAATFYAPAKAAVGWDLSLGAAFRVLGSKLHLCARVAVVLVFGCFLVVTLFALQVAALELSDRLNIFPLYGFFFINLLCGLFLFWFIVRSRKRSSLSRPGAVRIAGASPIRFGRWWGATMAVLNLQKVKAPTQTQGQPVAVLLIIKRQASVESDQKRRVAAA
jgi:hypothetical protein